MNEDYPVQYTVDYPDRVLNRVSTAFRIFAAIPIVILLTAITGYQSQWTTWDNGTSTTVIVVSGGTGLLFVPTLLMLLFREKYPRWWFDWNRELLRFMNRVGVYFALMDDRYPSTDEEQAVHLEFEHPTGLNRWLPLVKWFLAIPHYFVLAFLYLGAFFAVIGAWFAILFTGRYPRGIFDYLVGVGRWHNRVVGYAMILVTDQYPPFRLSP